MPDRRQKITDDEVFAAAQRAMTRRGPHELTLADIATEAGLTPGRLVQRFGGKRELLLALSARFARGARPIFAGLRSAHSSPLATIRAYAACMADLAPTSEALLRNLAYLQLDLTDPAFRGHLVENARATRQEMEALIRSAVVVGELRSDVNARSLARTVEAVISGSLMTWACYREGPAVKWICRDLEAVLRPHLPRGRGTQRPMSGRTGRSHKKRRPAILSRS
jgi:AcrR family transcriptional regulator